MRDLSIYVHIPFCVRKCLYCDFLSFPLTEKESYVNCAPNRAGEIENYVNLLLAEIQKHAPCYQKHRVITIFFGGGTPSLLTGRQIDVTLARIRMYYHVDASAEITVEMNPGTVDREKLKAYRAAGVNRISIGLQSAVDEELVRIGRIHRYEDFLRTYELARELQFHNINIDLMSALPGQSVASYQKTLEKAVSLAPEHISAYSLILEEGTPLYERQAEFTFPTEDEDREMYHMTEAYLEKYNYNRYEISNYARPGFACRHNQVYWRRGDYVGFGLGAASMTDNARWQNPDSFADYEAYVNGVGFPDRQRLTVAEQMEEFMFLGLRLTKGVNTNEFQDVFGKAAGEVYGAVIDKFCQMKLLERDGAYIRLTPKGLDVANYVMAEFLLG